MARFIYTKPILVDEVLTEKSYDCEVSLIRSSEEGSDVRLIMFDTISDVVIEEILTLQGNITTLDELEEYLLNTSCFTLNDLVLQEDGQDV